MPKLNALVKNLVKVSVEQLANKNQFVIRYNNPSASSKDYANIIAFQSYRSLIAYYIPSNDELFINWNKWDYSKTTLKHLKMFINDYTAYTYETKQQFTKLLTYHPKVIAFEE